jgi:hypothetical protein
MMRSNAAKDASGTTALVDGAHHRIQLSVLAAAHVGASLERSRFRRTDSQQAWTKPDGGQSAGVDLFVDLFAANEPILRQFRDRDVRF